MATCKERRYIAAENLVRFEKDYRNNEAKQALLERNTFVHVAENVDPIPDDGERSLQTQILILNEDCLNVAAKYAKEKPCVLNMASSIKPGGGWLNGVLAQEEILCLRSELWLSLANPFNSRATSPYPLSGKIIYSKDVTLFRDAAFKELKCRKVDFISVSAVQNPLLTPDGDYMSREAKALMKEKIRLMFRIVFHHQRKVAILSAFGCGAYHNPPHHVAHMFREVLAEKEFLNVFSKIIFAIVDGKNTRNFNVFNAILEKG
jgi:uncharacterized protein (TIGR02452 family)